MNITAVLVGGQPEFMNYQFVLIFIGSNQQKISW